MKELMIKPTIYTFSTAAEFAEKFKIGKGDLIITNQYIYDPIMKPLGLKCDTLFQEKYGTGEPSDEMAEAMYDIAADQDDLFDQVDAIDEDLSEVEDIVYDDDDYYDDDYDYDYDYDYDDDDYSYSDIYELY